MTKGILKMSNNSDDPRDRSVSKAGRTDTSSSVDNEQVEDDALSDAGSSNMSGGPEEYDAAAREAEKRRKSLASSETRAVQCWRLLVLLAVAAAAVVVSMLVYDITTNIEDESFQNAFDAHANRIIEQFHTSVASKMQAIDTFSAMYTTEGLREGSRGFPFVTLPDIDIHGTNTRVAADTLFFFYTPVVTDDNRAEWEQYSTETYGHSALGFGKEVSLRAQQDVKFNVTYPEEDGGDDEGDRRRNLQDTDIPTLEDGFKTVIWGDNPDHSEFLMPPNSGPHVPLWQISPVFPSPMFLNIDLFTKVTVKGSYEEVIRTGTAVLDEAANLEYDADAVTLMNYFLSTGQYRETAAEFSSEPVSGLAYPVFDSFDLVNRKVAGVLLTNIYWRLYFEDILPPDANGLIIVIENTFNQTLTYRIDGPMVTYLGVGDRHDPKFNSYGQSADVSSFVDSRAGPRTRGYVAADLNQEYIRYTLKVYPSEDLEVDYITNMPTIYTVTVASIFAFTSVVFILFVLVVERRQSVVLDSAVRSGAIVSALYPQAVRDRIYETTDAKPSKKVSKKNAFTAGANHSPQDAATGDRSADVSREARGRPIADLYPHSSILFADIVGFTSWSTKRTPVEVFELLEGLYSAFDRIAIRRKVFKVETIGDCYGKFNCKLTLKC